LSNSLQKDEGFVISSKPQKSSRKKRQIFENVKIVREQWVLVSVSKMECLQIIDLVSTTLMSVGGIIAGFAGLRMECGLLGVPMVGLGLLIHHWKVQRTLNNWEKKKGHYITCYDPD
jgi:hypothetical protein